MDAASLTLSPPFPHASLFIIHYGLFIDLAVASIAHHPFPAAFAATEKHDAVFLRGEGFGLEVGAFMTAIAPGLVGAFAARTPVHGFAFFYWQGVGPPNGFIHTRIQF